jgi:undecaprenyl-diphosphatase
MRRSGEPSLRQDDWTSALSSSLALAGFLFFVLVGFTMLAMAPLASLDTYLSLGAPPPRWVATLHLVDRVGQRAVCVPVLAVATYLCCRHRGSWRPAWVAAAAVLALNLAVLVLKLALGRGQAGTDPGFFVGGTAYPSGHTANIVLVYGLVAYLLTRYRGVSHRAGVALWSGVCVLAVTMVTTSLTLSWHWFGDLVAGLLVGAVLLQLTVAADTALLHRDAS